MPDKEQAAKRQLHRRRMLAQQIVTQLPADKEEALRLLDDVRWLLENFVTQADLQIPLKSGPKLAVCNG